ncbi:hypothetical protein [Burkholderia vietnamiensis]|uniref:hypothetical protein n=1 Tax=Burkholderia vietnamiensis TaxID=60552 RepID=UPI00158BA653|nr:hypothetical protein [Burkholderia vietnamiensis]
MGWLVDSRNIIEKEGDLDVHSSWRARHLYSYFGDGHVIENSSSDELFSSIPTLVEIICAKIPPGIVADSALILERKWVANSLPNFELIDAVCYGYEKLRNLVIAMDIRVGAESPAELLRDEPLLAISQTHRMILKLSDGDTYSIANTSNPIHVTEEAKKRFTEIQESIDEKMFSSGDSRRPLPDDVRAISRYAFELFRDSGFHISIVILLSNGKTANLMKFEPADHVEKIIFWHELAYSISLTDVDEIRFISEAWIREAGSFLVPASDWKIVGETLHVFGARRSGDCYTVKREIIRNGDVASLSDSPSESDAVPNFIIPVMRVWGHDDDWVRDQIAKAHSADL